MCNNFGNDYTIGVDDLRIMTNYMYCVRQTIPQGYFSEGTMRHLLPLKGQTERWLIRALDAILACKLTLLYGRYHLMSDLRYLALSEHRESYAQAETMVDFLNQLVPAHHTSPADLMRTPEEYMDESIDAYEEYAHYLNIFEGRFFCTTVAQRFCEMVYEADDYYTFKAFSNMNYSVFAEALLLYQMGAIDYLSFVNQFQGISLVSGKRSPLTLAELKLYLRTMHKIVNLYKSLLAEEQG